MTRPIIQEALTLIKRTETCQLHAYHGGADDEKVLTIGYGHVIKPDDCLVSPITQEIADKLFEKDVADHAQFIQGDIGNNVVLDDFVFGSLASFCYNNGARALRAAPSVREPMQHGALAYGLLRMFLFCRSGGQYRDGLFYRRLTEMVLALDHVLVEKPSECVAAKALMERLAKHGDVSYMTNYFATHHRKDLCPSCKKHS